MTSLRERDGHMPVIGEYGSNQIVGWLVSRVGIVESEQGSFLVRAPTGEVVQDLGLLR